MFNEIRKMIFLSKSKTIPQKLSVFTNKLTHIEVASVDEIEQFLSDAIKLENFILLYKGKMSDYLHLYYFNTVSHLKENLINLYENKAKDVLSSEDIIENQESIADINRICKKYNDTKIKDVKKKHKKPKKVRRRRSKRRALPKVRPARKKTLKANARRIAKQARKVGKILNESKVLNNIKKNFNSFIRKTIKPIFASLVIFIGLGSTIKLSSEVEAADLLKNTTKKIITDSEENNKLLVKSDTELMIEELLNEESSKVKFQENQPVYDTVSTNNIEVVIEENESLLQVVEEVDELLEEDQIIELDNSLTESDLSINEDTIIEQTDSLDLKDNSNLEIGEEISLTDGCHFYSNMYDAYFNENALNPAYNNEEVERKIKTIIVSNGETLKNVSTNEELENYYENGYEIVGCSVTNQYSTNGSVEGYYRLDDIKLNEYQKILK